MECFIVRPDDVSLADQTLLLRDDEARHAVRSLRLRIGENLIATDLAGTCYHASLNAIADQKKDVIAQCAIVRVLPEYHESKRSIILAQAILQQPSRFEEILEKATELGVTGFIPLITERTEKKQINRERLERILREATKQVSRARMPMLYEPVTLHDACRQMQGARVILHEAANTQQQLSAAISSIGNKTLTLFIGPEGGFTVAEVQSAETSGILVASLGERRLRAETAAIAAASIAASLDPTA